MHYCLVLLSVENLDEVKFPNQKHTTRAYGMLHTVFLSTTATKQKYRGVFASKTQIVCMAAYHTSSTQPAYYKYHKQEECGKALS